MNREEFEKSIDFLWERRGTLTMMHAGELETYRHLLIDAHVELQSNAARLVNNIDGIWQTDMYFVRAIKLYSQIFNGHLVNREWHGEFGLDIEHPGSILSFGAFVEANAYLHPCFINTGANIGPKVHIGAYAVIGAGVQIESNAWIGPHVILGGLFERRESRRTPVVIEEGAWIGAHTYIGAGIIVRNGARIDPGITIDTHTQIFDNDRKRFYAKEVPENAQVTRATAGTLRMTFPIAA